MAQGKKSKSNLKIEIQIAKSGVPPCQIVTGGSERYCSFKEVYKD
jgi:hypothetical protein